MMMTHITTNSAIADAEIEITPEMISAVMAILADYDPEVHRLDSTAGKIVRAVLQETVSLLA
jgi:hypothetical protein